MSERNKNVHRFTGGYTQEELDLIDLEMRTIVNETDQKIADGEYVEYNGMIIPKGAADKPLFDYHVQPLNYDIGDGRFMKVNVVLFTSLTKPKGPLEDNYAAQACMAYAMKAYRQWHVRTKTLILEDAPDVPIQYGNLFKTTAKCYSVSPDHVARHWPQVIKAFKIAFNTEIPPHIIRATQAILHPYLN